MQFLTLCCSIILHILTMLTSIWALQLCGNPSAILRFEIQRSLTNRISLYFRDPTNKQCCITFISSLSLVIFVNK